MNKQQNSLKDTAKLKQNFLDFQEFFTNASTALTNSEFTSLKTNCDELLGVFLGIKPLFAGINPDLITKLKLPEYLGILNELIFNKPALINLFKDYPEYFKFNGSTDFSEKFWEDFYNESDFALLNIKRGLCHGYPQDSVLNYSKSFELTYKIFNEININGNSKDKLLFNKYKLAGQSEAFFSAYQEDFLELFNRFGINISKDEYQILCIRSTGLVRGIGAFAWVGKTSKADIEYVSALNKLYEELKIEDYIQENFFD